jgi:hypothetical protein
MVSPKVNSSVSRVRVHDELFSYFLQVQVGVMTFATNPALGFKLGQFTSQNSILSALQQIPVSSGRFATNLGSLFSLRIKLICHAKSVLEAMPRLLNTIQNLKKDSPHHTLASFIFQV